MKKNLVLLITLFISYQISAQEKSPYDYIKVWNFLKFYHPDLASGKIDADSLFLENINQSQYLDINESIELLTKNLKNQFTTKSEPNEETDVLRINQDFSWYRENPEIKRKYRKLLNKIYSHRFTGKHYYDVSQTVYEYIIPHEKPYDFGVETQIPLAYRLLTMAKMIGTIDYLYPYKYLMPENANDELKKLIQQSITCESRKEFETILAKTAALFEDTHAFGFYKELHYQKEIYHKNYYAPFDYHVFEDHILVTNLITPDVCKEAGIAVGDRIMSINDISVKDMIREKSTLLSTSNKNKLLYYLSDYINNLIWTDDLQTKSLQIQKYPDRNEKTIKLALIDPTNKEQALQINEYYQQKLNNKAARKLEHDDIAYFRTDQTFSLIDDVDDDQIDATLNKIFEEAASKKAIVFDMRAYPDWGGFAFNYVYNYFSPKENWFGKYYRQNLNNIGTYAYVYKSATIEYFPDIPNKTTHNYNGKVFIIVDPATQSMSEWNTMNFQHVFPQAITIGEQTAGADGDMKYLTLPGGYSFGFTANAVFYPDNTLTQKVGVKIDEIIHYTDTDILNQKDIPFEIILKAIE
ncbi:hypothetical protein C9994_03705 [Marivirga lumbricoides]|uniref:Tail specific protease domain-containing protein n=1 Tax=Marivirga lumbricoides TaxID=1046115 RepID=A0A2T4DTU5_9BACT|nr:hypothetical protein C9994_03705 [Marivirga lumbricoides]